MYLSKTVTQNDTTWLEEIEKLFRPKTSIIFANYCKL